MVQGCGCTLHVVRKPSRSRAFECRFIVSLMMLATLSVLIGQRPAIPRQDQFLPASEPEHTSQFSNDLGNFSCCSN